MNELSLYVIKMIFSAEIWLIFLFLNMAFLVLYFSVTTSVYRISNWLLKNRRIYQIEKGSTFDGQIKFEIIHSLYSILIFALYGVITILLLRAEVLEIANNRGWTIVLHLVILFL